MEVIGQYHASATLPLGRQPFYPWNGKLFHPKNLSGRFGDEINFIHVQGIESLISGIFVT